MGDDDFFTLRHHFAGQVLGAVYSEFCRKAASTDWPDNWRELIAAESYKMADAMLKEGEK